MKRNQATPMMIKTSIMAIRNSLDGLNCGLDTAEEQKVNWKIDLKKLPRREHTVRKG